MKKSSLNLLFLLSIWIGVTFWAIMQYDKSLFSLTRAHSQYSIESFSEDKLLKGGKISGSFVAEYDNLGTMSLNFAISQRVAYRNEDRLVFRLRELGSKEWYFQSLYKSGLVYDAPMFPFGFPIISNSKGKTYEFELTSFQGDEKNALSLKKGYPTVESRYILSRSDVIGGPLSVIDFISKKFVNKITTLEIVYISVIAMLPSVLYILWFLFLFKYGVKVVINHSRIKKMILRIAYMYESGYSVIQESYYFTLGVLLLLAVVLDVVLVHLRTNIIYLVVMLLWMRSFKKNKKADLISALIALALLIVCPVLLTVNLYESSLKSGAWSLIFFACAVVYVVAKRNFQK